MLLWRLVVGCFDPSASSHRHFIRRKLTRSISQNHHWTRQKPGIKVAINERAKRQFCRSMMVLGGRYAPSNTTLSGIGFSGSYSGWICPSSAHADGSHTMSSWLLRSQIITTPLSRCRIIVAAKPVLIILRSCHQEAENSSIGSYRPGLVFRIHSHLRVIAVDGELSRGL